MIEEKCGEKKSIEIDSNNQFCVYFKKLGEKKVDKGKKLLFLSIKILQFDSII